MIRERLKTIGGVLVLILLLFLVGYGVIILINKNPKPVFTYTKINKLYVGEPFEITWTFDKLYSGPIKLEFVETDSNRNTTIIQDNENGGMHIWIPPEILSDRKGKLRISAGNQVDYSDTEILISNRKLLVPDITITAKYNNSIICKGADNQIEVIVKNDGDAIAKDFEVKLYPNMATNITEAKYVVQIESLQPNSERTLHYNVKYSRNNTISSIRAKLHSDTNTGNNEARLTANFSPLCIAGSLETLINTTTTILPYQIINGTLIDTIYLKPNEKARFSKTSATVIREGFIGQTALENLMLDKNIDMRLGEARSNFN